MPLCRKKGQDGAMVRTASQGRGHEFKSQPCHLPAWGSGTSHMVSPCLSLPICLPPRVLTKIKSRTLKRTWLIMNSIWASISSQKVLMWDKISCLGSQSQKVEVSWFNPTPQRGAQTQCCVGLTGLYQRETVSCSISRTFMNSLFKRGYYEKLNYINSQSNKICSKQR